MVSSKEKDRAPYGPIGRMYFMDCETLLARLRAGDWDDRLAPLYPDLDAARARAARVVEGFVAAFGNREGTGLFSGPGRTELGGNHTDHQHGRVLCGSVDMDMLACAAPNGTRTARVISGVYPALEVDLTDLSVREEERNTSAALVRGMAAAVDGGACRVEGFDAYVTSTVLSGSGLSSSAAYEVLMGNLLNSLFLGGELDPLTIARYGQYAENVFFGKPCGLMDQMGSSVGGAVAIDFKDPAAPVVQKIDYDFSRSGYTLCIVDTGASHADLTEDYAAIPAEMGAAAAFFGKTWLREVEESAFRESLPALRERCGDRAVLRALHFFEEDRRTAAEADALARRDFGRFLELVEESGLSSQLHLQNIWSVRDTRQQAVELSLTLGRELLGGRGAIRVHGGGFAGTIQAWVPDDRVVRFQTGMEAVLGQDRCHVLHIRPVGGCVIIR